MLRRINGLVINDVFIRCSKTLQLNKLRMGYKNDMTQMFPIFIKFRRDRRKHNFNVVPYKRVKHYKYYLWLNKLPLRGQRTHTNAKTIKYSVIYNSP